MSSHSPSQASECVFVCVWRKDVLTLQRILYESRHWECFTLFIGSLSLDRGTDWAFSAPATVRDQGARPQLSARSCKRSLGNSRIRFAWGSDTRPHSPRAWTSGYSRNVCRISTSHLSTWCWWCVVGINWHSVAPTEVYKYRVLIIAR